jgi:ribosome-associated translation inhibitor RaiA
MSVGIPITDPSQFIVVFKHLEPSDAIRTRAEYFMAKLARVSTRIMRAVMTIEGRHHHHHQGNVYHISLRLQLPRGEVVVSHDPELNHAHEDVYVAMRDAITAAKRQLRAYEQRFGGKGSQHEQERFDNRPEQQPE